MKTQFQKIKSTVMSKISNNLITLSFLALIVTLLSSCSQDVGDRYKVVFWFNEDNSRLLLDDGAETLSFSINGQVVATSPVDDIFWETAPSCDDGEAIKTQVDLLPRNSNIIYSVTDQTGFVYFNGNKQLITNSCNAIEIGPIIKHK